MKVYTRTQLPFAMILTRANHGLMNACADLQSRRLHRQGEMWVNYTAIRYIGSLLKWDMWIRIERNSSLGPINTHPFDHKSGSPESLLGLLPDINKPPI